MAPRGYGVFARTHRTQFKVAHPRTKDTRITRMLRDHWENLNDNQRAPYNDAAAQNPTQNQMRLAPAPPVPALPNPVVNLAPPPPPPIALPPPPPPPPPPGPINVQLDPQAAQDLQNIGAGVQQILAIVQGLQGVLAQVGQPHAADERRNPDDENRDPHRPDAANRDPNQDDAGDPGPGRGDDPGAGAVQARPQPTAGQPRQSERASRRQRQAFPPRYVVREVDHNFHDDWHKNNIIGQKQTINIDYEDDEGSIRGDWVGAQVLGVGGQGIVSLWVQHNEDGRITDRIAVKDQYPVGSDWRDPLNWIEGTWREIAIQQDLGGSDRYTLRLRGSHVDEDNRFIRIYTEYAPYGDLRDLIWRFKPGHEYNPAGRQEIPEKFIWYIFLAIVESCLVQRQGDPADKINDWSPIVHCDLKPENVLLAAPQAGYFGAYPKPLICDFGQAIYENKNGRNPEDCLQRGTPGFQAPEQKDWVPSRPFNNKNDNRISAPTNVYGIGTIIWNLMNVEHTHPVIYNPNMRRERPLHYRGVEDNVSYLNPPRAYDRSLISMVQDCLLYLPSNRPTLENLRRQILRNMADAGMEPDSETDSGDALNLRIDEWELRTILRSSLRNPRPAEESIDEDPSDE